MSGVPRWAVASAGLLASLAVSVALYLLTDSVLVFLFVPFVPLLWDRGDESVRRCPACGFEPTDESVNYCPRDGTELD
ncbi:zinc ribbon domain-containing protein [Halorarius halobius]|uniref:zinc ribbon domain-containing protein n=1 Tax=Halorarius halobius TaxID=2962671 RepID=UPI0020CCA470|nr:zinc ribbon domain-containing protein [Halorarius halobius]